jgi:hypothetical protein
MKAPIVPFPSHALLQTFYSPPPRPPNLPFLMDDGSSSLSSLPLHRRFNFLPHEVLPPTLPTWRHFLRHGSPDFCSSLCPPTFRSILLAPTDKSASTVSTENKSVMKTKTSTSIIYLPSTMPGRRPIIDCIGTIPLPTDGGCSIGEDDASHTTTAVHLKIFSVVSK